jgi:outer membrane lipoprotein SlyB
MSANHWKNLGLLMVVIGLVSCSTAQSPVLYPNAHLQRVGQAQADRDIAACRDLASQYVESTAGKDIAKSTAIGTVGGAAVGAAGGAVSGRGAGLGAAIGSAAGGTAGAVRGTAKQIGPSRVYKSYVNRCLREKGYDVIGWQ